MLWAYNLNYMDWLNQSDFTAQKSAEWIDKFIADLPTNRVGLDPYPIALRSINWIKVFTRYPQLATKSRLDALYSQVKHLQCRLEYHLLGNHLLEDLYALFIAGNFFDDNQLLEKAKKLLIRQLDEQILSDGAHYEQSPMYHCILLDRLLDCINFDQTNDITLRNAASLMLGHLESIKWNDDEIPLFNDAAFGISPKPSAIFSYARRLELKWSPLPLDASGYRRLVCGKMTAIVDVGNITASYQPGHTHADALSFEMRVDNKPVIVDTGISTYNKNQRRQYERSTSAHNTVSINGRDSSEVWGGFRVGRRCKVNIVADSDNQLIAELSTGHRRQFKIDDTGLTITDTIPSGCMGTSYIHLAHNISPDIVKIYGGGRTVITPVEVATQYNKLLPALCIQTRFVKSLTLKIMA
jgi:hypothetical protein